MAREISHRFSWFFVYPAIVTNLWICTRNQAIGWSTVNVHVISESAYSSQINQMGIICLQIWAFSAFNFSFHDNCLLTAPIFFSFFEWRIQSFIKIVLCCWICAFLACSELYKSGFSGDGVYRVRDPWVRAEYQVFCDQSRDSGGWTVIQVAFRW